MVGCSRSQGTNFGYTCSVNFAKIVYLSRYYLDNITSVRHEQLFLKLSKKKN